jgi:hypothetical protein
MVLHLVVAMPTRVPMPTLVALHLDIALVMLTTQRRAIFCGIKVLVLPVRIDTLIVIRSYSVRRLGISRAQIVRVLGVDFGGGRYGRRDIDIGKYRLAGGRGERAVVGGEAARRLWAQEVVSCCHKTMYHASLVLVRYAQISDLVNPDPEMAEPIVCR